MTEEKMTFLTEREAAEYLGVSLHILRTMESDGSLIPFRTLGGHCGYSLRMLNEYLEKSCKPSLRRESESDSEVRDVSLLPVPEIQDQSSPPIDVLKLSTHIYRCLQRSGLHTVAQVAALGQEDLLAIRQLGPKALAEIREKLTVYLAKHPLPDEVEESLLEPEVQAVEPLPPQPPPLPPDPTPLDVLGFSIRPYNALRRSDITSVGQLARMSDEEIRGVRNIGPKSLTEIKDKLKAYLAEHPLPDEAEGSLPEPEPEPETPAVESLPPQPPSPPPDPTPIDVLGLSIRSHNALRRENITTIGQLVRMSDEEIKGVRNIGPKSLAEIQKKLQAYLFANPALATRLEKALAQQKEPPVGTPLAELDIPREVQGELQAVGIRSIEEVVGYSEEELLLQLGLGYSNVFILKQGLSQRDLALALKPILQPLVESSTLNALDQRGVPLDEISITRLALPETWEETLRRTDFGNVQELAMASGHVLEAANFFRRPDIVSKIQARLNRYLAWLLQQDSWESEVSGQDISPMYLIELSETSLEEIIQKLLVSLRTGKQQDIIKLRYGLSDGEIRSLEEVGQLLGITRERVRQVQQKALKTLNKSSPRKAVKALAEVLEDAFRQAGGLLTEEQIVEVIESYVGIGDIDCCGAICLIMEIGGRFVHLKKERVWGLLDGYPLEHVSAINRLMERLLKAARAPLPKGDLLARFKMEQFYEERKRELTDEFLVACINTNGKIEILNDEYYGLRRWAKSRVSRMVMILRALGCPAHYAEIARLTNELLPASMHASDHVVHAQLQRESDIFVWVDRGTYGLKEWGLEKSPYYADIIAEVLEGEGHPLPAGEILKRVEEIRPAKESTVMMTLTMHPRFRQVDGETYGLRSWRLPGEDVEERPLPADVLEDMKQHIFQQLIEQA